MDEAAFSRRIESLSDEELLRESFEQLDGANQFPYFTDWDKRARLCLREADRRERPDIYDRAFEAALAAAKGDRAYRRAAEQLGLIAAI